MPFGSPIPMEWTFTLFSAKNFATGFGSIQTFASPSVTRTTFLSAKAHESDSEARSNPSHMFVHDNQGISCRIESVVTLESIAENASRSDVSGLTRNGFQAKTMSQILSPSRFETKSAITRFATSSRLGEMSSASIDFETSKTKTMSVHSFFSVFRSRGCLGSPNTALMTMIASAARKDWKMAYQGIRDAFVSDGLRYLPNLASRRMRKNTGSAETERRKNSGRRNSIANSLSIFLVR